MPHHAIPDIFNSSVRKAFQYRALKAGWKNSLFDHIAQDLDESLGLIKRNFHAITVIGFPALSFFSMLRMRYQGSVIQWIFPYDLSDFKENDFFAEIMRLKIIIVRRDDHEKLPLLAQSQDLIISFMVLHAVNDPVGEMIQIRMALISDGLFQAVLFGEETLRDLSVVMAQAEQKCRDGVSPHIFPMIDLKSMGGLLGRAGFSLPVASLDYYKVAYISALQLMQDIRKMGEGNCLQARDKRGLTRAIINDILQNYTTNYGRLDGKILAHFNVISLHGWVPHESQQKPLRPGTATHKLKDFL